MAIRRLPGQRPKPTDPEPVWSQYMAAVYGGFSEAPTFDGSRVDILTATHAWEVEWIKKWQEAPGQALFYAAATGRAPGVLLLSRGKPREELYFLRCLAVCNQAGIDLRVEQTRGDGSLPSPPSLAFGKGPAPATRRP